jgi:hypothetical protein
VLKRSLCHHQKIVGSEFFRLLRYYEAWSVLNRCFWNTSRSHRQGSNCPRWDRQVLSKRRFLTTLRRVITQKTENFSSTAAEANYLATLHLVSNSGNCPTIQISDTLHTRALEWLCNWQLYRNTSATTRTA